MIYTKEQSIEHLKNFQNYATDVSVEEALSMLEFILSCCPNGQLDWNELNDELIWVMQKEVAKEIRRLNEEPEE